jgi:L-amino acid N-acyltransferase YncA
VAGRAGSLNLVIAEAGSEDWPEIWEIFRGVVSTGDTYPYPPDISEQDAHSTWMRPGGSHEATFVARLDDDLVATAYLKANGPGLSDHVANAGWMVSPDHQGRGIGRVLAEWVIDQARANGYHGMQFNAVVATNTGAIALWESLGFEIVGTVPDAFRHAREGLTPVHIMYRPLQS